MINAVGSFSQQPVVTELPVDSLFGPSAEKSPVRAGELVALGSLGDDFHSSEVPGLGAKPELRPAKVSDAQLDDENFVKKLQESFALVMMLILKVILNGSDNVKSDMAREVRLTHSQAESMRKAGVADMSRGLAKGAMIGLATGAGVFFSARGYRQHIQNFKQNGSVSREIRNELGTSASSASEATRMELGARQIEHQVAHDINFQQASMKVNHGNAFQPMGAAAGAIADGIGESEISVDRADQKVAEGDTTVQTRQTDVDKSKRDQDAAYQIHVLEVLDSVVQGRANLASVIAQNARG